MTRQTPAEKMANRNALARSKANADRRRAEFGAGLLAPDFNPGPAAFGIFHAAPAAAFVIHQPTAAERAYEAAYQAVLGKRAAWLTDAPATYALA